MSPAFKELKTIEIKGANEHNLKSIDVSLPRHQLVVITGLSGSGKSSLAFNTIYAEGQRRYVESLSSYARQFLDQMQKPDIESITGLTPTISIEQRTGKATPRSIVATTTEIYDYLRILFARIGKPHCPYCEQPILKQSAEDMTDQIMSYPERTRVYVLSPLIRGKKGEHRDVIEYIQKEGFVRVRIDEEIYLIDEIPKLAKTKAHTIEAVVDRLALSQDNQSRLQDSIETGLRLSDGLLSVILENKEDRTKQEVIRFSANFSCPTHGSVLEELTARAFSFNSPYGSCPDCVGLGSLMEPAVELVIPNEDVTLAQGAIHAWKRCGSGFMPYKTYDAAVKLLGKLLNVKTNVPWKELSKQQQDELLYGKKEGRKVVYEGIITNMRRRFKETSSDTMKERVQEFMAYLPCPTCNGQRLRASILAVRIEDKNIADIIAMTIREAYEYFVGLELEKEAKFIAEPISKAILDRLGFLNNVGLSYLNLNRRTNTLSGGETQRIRLASQVGSQLVGVTYVLDEPTIGLHQRDNDRLLNTLKQLRDIGNSVIIVEHDEDVIRSADYLLDMGPASGVHGGEVVSVGTPQEVMDRRVGLTAAYLNGEKEIPVPLKRRALRKTKQLIVRGAKANNLKNVTASFPLGQLICVTGVSGSGKSSLVNECLLKGVQKRRGNMKVQPGEFASLQGVDLIDKLIHIDQSPIGRTSRSTPATYTGAFDEIRKLFATTKEAKVRGYTAGRFSFNVAGGRCEACQGQGTKTIEMYFLPNVNVVCETCQGRRYNRETLQVVYKGKNIYEVLSMPIEEACEFFKHHRRILPPLQTLTDVGLGYIRLGQISPTLSGGEAQRIKLASELTKRETGNTLYILDEPTTGLHFHDISMLINVVNRLVDLGNTVVIIEHNLDVIKCADWIIDIGKEGGKDGGQILFEGSPEDLIKQKDSYTGAYLKPLLLAKK